MGRLTKRPGVAAAAARFLVASRVAGTRQRGRDAEEMMAKMSEAEVKERLAYSAEELDADLEAVRNGSRNAQSVRGLMELRLGYTVTKPEQKVVGDVQVQVVVNSLKRAEYALPAEGTTASLPGVVDAE